MLCMQFLYAQKAGEQAGKGLFCLNLQTAVLMGICDLVCQSFERLL